ncbi:MAG: metallophosphoesterase [Streptosporangiaceae bacterium]
MRPSSVRLVYHLLLDNRVVTGGARLLGRGLSRQQPGLTRHEVHLDALPAHLDGLRLLHVTDLHMRDRAGPAARLPELVASLSHDLALYTGDFIDGDEGIDPLVTLLSAIPARADAYAVLGNHDYWALSWQPRPNDTARLERALAGLGITVLRNAAAPACHGQLYIAGVDDPVTGRDDVGEAMAAVPRDAACILMAHSPDILLRLDGRKPSLVLAGHTHGGQVRLPVLGPLVNMTSLPRHLAMGYRLYQGVPLFVSRGLGYSGVDVRFLCPPQVALLELRAVDRKVGRPDGNELTRKD